MNKKPRNKPFSTPGVAKDANIAKLIYEHPETEEVLVSFGLRCVGCFANQFDTIEAGAKIHGMMDEEIEEMIKEINKTIDETSKSQS